jgi:hypothetical protein
MWHYLVFFFPIKIPSFVAFFILLVIAPWIIYKVVKFFFGDVIPGSFHCYQRIYKGMENYLDDLHMKERSKEIAELATKEQLNNSVIPIERRPLIDYEPSNEMPLRAKLVTLYFIFSTIIILLALYTFIKNH